MHDQQGFAVVPRGLITKTYDSLVVRGDLEGQSRGAGAEGLGESKEVLTHQLQPQYVSIWIVVVVDCDVWRLTLESGRWSIPTLAERCVKPCRSEDPTPTWMGRGTWRKRTASTDASRQKQDNTQ